MNTVMRTSGQAVAAAAVAVALLLGAMQAQGADAAPIKDTRPMADKVRSLKENCEETGGTFTDRPSATDDGKTITNCSGGGLATVGCVLTATTSECMTVREKPTEGVPDLINNTDLGGTDSPAEHTTTPDASPSVAAPDDDQDQDTSKSKGKKGKKGGKGRKK